jgi:hypothetical protein
VIIHQTLYSLFPPSSFDPTLIIPLTPPEFIQRILVPEAAVGLIMEDRFMDPKNEKHKEQAVRILRESAAYGVAMFPDADTNGGANGKGKGLKDDDDDDWDMGVGDEIVRERARARRKELEEEERIEDELWAKKESERIKREGGGKKKKKEEDTKPKGKQKEKEQEVVEISETSDTGRPRPRPRKVQREKRSAGVLLSSDASQKANGRRTAAKPKHEAPSNNCKQRGTTADIDLCSTSSDDVTRQESREKTKGKETAKTREPSIDSMHLEYPPTDAMSVDDSDRMSDVSSATRRTRADKKGKKKAKASGLKPLEPNCSIVSLLSEDEETPRPKKAPGKFNAPLSIASSAATSDSKSSFPLQIARDRRTEA